MAEKPAAEKTEKPTGKRLNKVRSEGQVPMSPEFMSLASVLGLTIAITLMAPRLMQWCQHEITSGLSCDTICFQSREGFTNFVASKVTGIILITAPISAVIFTISVIANIVVQGRFNYSPKAIKFKFNVINPAGGLGKLFNVKSLVTLGMSLAKLIFIGIVTWVYIQGKLEEFAVLRWAWSFGILIGICKIILGVLIRILAVMLIIGLIDLAYQKWKYTNDLKMTKQEVKEEQKQMLGPPEVKQHIRKMQVKMAMSRMLQNVPEANVILVNPTHYAVALQYDSNSMDSPVVVAKGADHIAQKIREIGRAYGVPVVRRPELTRAIYKSVDIGRPIPELLYVAVAEVMALVYRLKKQRA